ncbi:hypothetical protein HNR20_001445 [Micromonospora parathelypteridis]|uniref:Uncharacterized protein n=1 Tax=Micromonospora parathelypteridis TaxID=1839617 RepID=A0A840VWH2_9ACTN|nr:hypothetical protein [Micromonospora parathelypteridis]
MRRAPNPSVRAAVATVRPSVREYRLGVGGRHALELMPQTNRPEAAP